MAHRHESCERSRTRRGERSARANLRVSPRATRERASSALAWPCPQPRQGFLGSGAAAALSILSRRREAKSDTLTVAVVTGVTAAE